MSTFRKYFLLCALSLGYAASYLLPYIKYVFYDQLLAGVGCTNEQAGWLVTLYAGIAVALYIPGGWVADKYKTKTVLWLSLLGTGILNFVFALHMTYTTAVIVWVLLAFTTAFAFWCVVLKAVRLLGTAQEQGRMYGFFNSGVGAFSAIVSSIGVFVYGLYSANAVGGLKAVIIVQGIVCILSGLIVLFFYQDSGDAAGASEDDKFKTSDIFIVLKNPMTWAISLLILCGHGIYTSQSYFNPYMTNVIGVTMTFSGVLAIVRTHVLRIACGPLGGILADKLQSPTKVLVVCFSLMTLVLCIFMALPHGTSATTVIALQLFLAGVTFTGYSILYSTMEEAGLPRKVTGTTVAVASIIGYAPDMIYNPLFGIWLDKFQNAGYLYIFTFLAATGVLGIILSIIINRKGAKVKAAALNAA